MIIPSAKRETLTGPAGDESQGVGVWPWHVFDILEARIKVPGIEEYKPLYIYPEVDYHILNDDGWILKGISRELSNEITEWPPILGTLDPRKEYILRADDETVTLMLA